MGTNGISSISRSGITILFLAIAAFLNPTDSVRAMQLSSWDELIPNAANRFKVLSAFDNQAVLDKETGLVWQRTPEASFSWYMARNICATTTTGNRRGWRLPSVHELNSLIDPLSMTNPTGPVLPSGHPFVNVVPAYYWSSTMSAEVPNAAWIVDFGFGSVGFTTGLNDGFPVWCVRGSSTEHQY